MELTEHFIAPSSKLVSEYIGNESRILNYFEYKPEAEEFGRRYASIVNHPADRVSLAGLVRSYMERFGISESADQHLQQLAEGAPTVVTGQQAGILTGPLYTVHKAISAIVLAKEASASLNRKVVPVFWIAGEDHDLAEIAHVYRELNGRVDKLNFPHAEYGKQAASTAMLNHGKLWPYMEELFRSLPETAHSKELFSLVEELFKDSSTFTDFFAVLLNHLFRSEGLLFIDAAFPALRKYESKYFKKLIEQAGGIAETVYKTEQELLASGYQSILDAKEEAAHLFILVKGERVLLERDKDRFVGKDGQVSFSKAELLHIAEKAPERLSNNVVTRPLMQEMVFPVLAFVGGPGEIAYWAALKGAFNHIGLEMPVVMPRLNMTIVSRKVQSLLQKYEITPASVIAEKKISELRSEFSESIREKEAENMLASVEDELKLRYMEIEAAFTKISKGLTPIVEKNLAIHLKQLDFLKHKLEAEVMLQHDTTFRHYTAIENELNPEGNFQERVYTPLHFLNEYGLDFVERLAELPFNYSKNHKIICL